jgi:ligand-binding sensor domain-containing protein
VWAGTENGLALIEKGQVRQVYKPEDGLAHRVVMGIAVDRGTGDLWIATFGGVSHFSGGRFENFTNLSSGLLNDICYGIAVVDHFVWVATTAGVSRYNTNRGEWSSWSERNVPFHSPVAYGVVPAGNKMYVALWGGGVMEYDVPGDSWKSYTDPDEEVGVVLLRNRGLVHNVVSSVAWNPDTGMVWASTHFGLSGYDGRNWHNYLSTDSGLASDFINAASSRRNEVWACTDRGLSMLDYFANTWVTYRKLNPEDVAAGSKPAHAAVKGGAKAIQAAAMQGEIELTSPDNQKQKLRTPTALAHNYILNMDFQGDEIWVATAQGLSHGIPEPQKESQPYAKNKTSRSP